VWKLLVPPRVQFFLWLLSKNKFLIRDNLEKRRHVDDTSCLFRSEPESISHMFFECVVARKTWVMVSSVLGVESESNYENLAKYWLCNKKFGVINMVSLVVCL
jgi:hypothetical protein